MNENPLKEYFRRPSIHITLPSKGEFYPDGSIEIPVTGEIPIYPMTAIDEITYKTPDALFNGSAVADVIKSCVPAIIDPWVIPNDDLISILTAIRIASFGHNMEIDTVCTKCQEVATYSLDLRNVLDHISTIDYTKSFDLHGLKIFFKPLSYKEINNNNLINFEEQKLASVVALRNDMDEDEKLKLLSETFKKVSSFTLNTIVKNIDRIESPETTVQEPEYILDFLKHCERNIYNGIKDYIINQRQMADIKPLNITCDDCGHEYQQPFTVDMTTFFE